VKRSFSFTGKSNLFLLQQFPGILPGIEQVLAIYYDREFDSLKANSIVKENDRYRIEETQVKDADGAIQELRKNSSTYLWMQAEDIPFQTSSKDKVQLSIFNELNNNILLIRIYNDSDGNHDLFFIYFNQNLSHFGILNSKTSLTTEHKSIIGHLIKNAITNYLSNFREDRELFISLNDNIQDLVSELQKSKNDLAYIKQKNKDGILHLSRGHLADLSREYGYIFHLTDLASNKIQEFEGELGTLRAILEKAVQAALAMQVNSMIRDIVIADYHLNLNPYSIVKKIEVPADQEQVGDIPARYNRTYLFLNKLENAALHVKSKNLLLTSANVGSEFPSPITPSAITDALKNHRVKIIHLFSELPNRWQTIRSEFRPVQNILNPRQEHEKRTG
jgi:hypothetical protein